MGAVNTTYTFTPTDVITSSKMNDIIDQTTMTSTAISGGTLQVTTSGQLAVSAQGITSNELAAASVTQTKIGNNVVGTGPAFKLFPAFGTTVPVLTPTKIMLNSERVDTNNDCANSRFTPKISGLYFITAQVSSPTPAIDLAALLYVNGASIANGTQINASSSSSTVSSICILNGSSDYVELFAYHNSTGSRTMAVNSHETSMSGFLIRPF